VVLVLLAFLSACGGGPSASDRTAACEQRYRAGLDDTPAARRAVSGLCAQAEQAGLLDDHGATTADQLRTLLKAHPAALSPLCQLSLQASLGADTAADAPYLPPGGVHALTAKACHNLGPYLTDDGSTSARCSAIAGAGCGAGVRGRLAGVAPQPVAALQQGRHAQAPDPHLPAGWSHGLLHADGSVDSAALAALGTKISRQMLASGEITTTP
jgi:hypothetical protein